MSEHTPGPWKAVPIHVHNDGHDDEQGGLGWRIQGPAEPQLRGQFSRAADAKLIAAAPDLLAACELGGGSVLGNDGPDILRLAADQLDGMAVGAVQSIVIRALQRKANAEEAAIAKAKGEDTDADQPSRTDELQEL